MTQRVDHDYFDENLIRAGQSLPWPASPTAEQFARWRTQSSAEAHSGVSNNGQLSIAPGRTRRSLPMLLSRGLVGGALAATFILIAWLSMERQQTVSANVIFNSLAESISQPIWVELDNIDLGSVIFNGRFYFDNADELIGPGAYYSELAATFRSASPEWVDHESLVVICQADDQHWQFIRGSGVAGSEVLPDGRYRMRSSPERLAHGYPTRDMRKSFDFRGTLIAEGGMGVGRADSRTRFERTQEQVHVMSQMFEWIRELREQDSPRQIVQQLNEIAEHASISSIDRTTLELIANDLRIDAIDEYYYQTDETIVAECDMTSKFLPRYGGVGWSMNRLRPEELRDHRAVKAAIRNILDALNEAGTSAEKTAAVYRQYADDVEIIETDYGGWTITARNMRIQGVRPDLPTGARPLPELLRNTTLVVRYDLLEQRMIDAAFKRVGGDGVIRIYRAEHGLDPELTSPERWITDETVVRGMPDETNDNER